MEALWTLYAFGPAAGVVVVALILLRRREWSFRIAGLAGLALVVAFLVAYQVWDNNACWDVGEPPGCGTIVPVLLGTWLASTGVVLAGIGTAIWHRARQKPDRSR